jgi:hypothetical protein
MFGQPFNVVRVIDKNNLIGRRQWGPENKWQSFWLADVDTTDVADGSGFTPPAQAFVVTGTKSYKTALNASTTILATILVVKPESAQNKPPEGKAPVVKKKAAGKPRLEVPKEETVDPSRPSKDEGNAKADDDK